ncbi:MAG: hypothetical protein ACRDVL_05625 [Acidimicrobiia bacterium]
MNAARALAAADLDRDEVRLALHPIHPEAVNLYPASPLLKRLWGEGITGITLWKWVFVDPDVLDGDPGRLGRLALHELFHLRQIAERGLPRFLLSYAGDYIRGRLRGFGHSEAYREIGVEQEAREATGRLSGPTPI